MSNFFPLRRKTNGRYFFLSHFELRLFPTLELYSHPYFVCRFGFGFLCMAWM